MDSSSHNTRNSHQTYLVKAEEGRKYIRSYSFLQNVSCALEFDQAWTNENVIGICRYYVCLSICLSVWYKGPILTRQFFNYSSPFVIYQNGDDQSVSQPAWSVILNLLMLLKRSENATIWTQPKGPRSIPSWLPSSYVVHIRNVFPKEYDSR